MIYFYKEFGDLGYLANYSNHSFTVDGISYKTVEHYYQAMKYDNKEIRDRIIKAETPKEASNIGRDRNNIRIKDFKKIKNEVMYKGILEKFRQNRDIAYKLIETRNQGIAEATIDEYYWGIGKDNSGKNNIGKILKRVRKAIKKEILDNIIKKAESLDEVYIIGHFNPDIDSIFSSYLLSRVLISLGINAKFAFLEDYVVNENDKRIYKDFLNIEPVIVDKNHKFILVDHNNLAGLDKDNVIGAIDHHIISGEVYDTIEIEYASTGLLIYDLFRNIYEFSLEEKKLVAMTVLTDTDYQCSKRFKKEDKRLFEKLNLDLNISSLQEKYFVITNFNKPIEEVIKDQYKEYDRDSKHIKRTMIYSYKEEYDKYFDIYLDYVKENNLMLIWCDFEEKKTYIYYDNKMVKLNYILTSTNIALNLLSK